MKFSFKKHSNHAPSQQRKLTINFGSNPRIDWIAVLILSIAAGAVSVYGAVSLFLNIRDGEVPTVGIPASIGMTINAAEISKVVAAYEARRDRFEVVSKTPYSRTSDPAK